MLVCSSTKLSTSTLEFCLHRSRNLPRSFRLQKILQLLSSYSQRRNLHSSTSFLLPQLVRFRSQRSQKPRLLSLDKQHVLHNIRLRRERYQECSFVISMVPASQWSIRCHMSENFPGYRHLLSFELWCRCLNLAAFMQNDLQESLRQKPGRGNNKPVLHLCLEWLQLYSVYTTMSCT